jgi:hypothetical protein
LINNQTATKTSRASNHWISASMRGQDATLERLRVDRQLEEALTHGPDPLHLAEVFGLDEKTAMRYADSARALLEQAAETSPRVAHEPTGPSLSIRSTHPRVLAEEPAVSANSRGSDRAVAVAPAQGELINAQHSRVRLSDGQRDPHQAVQHTRSGQYVVQHAQQACSGRSGQCHGDRINYLLQGRGTALVTPCQPLNLLGEGGLLASGVLAVQAAHR